MHELQKVAEIFYSKHGDSYEGICDNSNTTLSDVGDLGRLKRKIDKENGENGVIGCKDSDNGYAVISSLNLKDCWCVDWQGKSEEVKLEGAPNCRAKLNAIFCP